MCVWITLVGPSGGLPFRFAASGLLLGAVLFMGSKNEVRCRKLYSCWRATSNRGLERELIRSRPIPAGKFCGQCLMLLTGSGGVAGEDPGPQEGASWAVLEVVRQQVVDEHVDDGCGGTLGA